MTDQIVNEVRIDDEWESLVSQGLELRENQDDNQWKLGELGSSVESRYGQDSIGTFATDIGVVKKTLMNYRTVYNAFANSGLREKFPKLSFSHFKTVQATSEPEYWLHQADSNDWSIEKLCHELSQNNPDPNLREDEKPNIFRCKECNLWRIEDVPLSAQCRGHYSYVHGKIRYS